MRPANLNFYPKEACGRRLAVMQAAPKEDCFWLDPDGGREYRAKNMPPGKATEKAIKRITTISEQYRID